MAQIQKRIHELLPYIQLAPGEAGYVDPATIWLALDKNDWTEPMKVPFSMFLSLYHVETASIAPTSISVNVSYETSFDNSSYFFNRLQVYKTVTIPGIGDVQQTVPYHDLVKTINGFSLTLAEYEDVIITYFATEPSLGSALVKDNIYATGSVAGIVVPSAAGQVQITGFASTLGSGITLASDEFTVRRAGRYSVDISFSTFNETAESPMLIVVENDTPTDYDIERQMTPRNDYDNFGVKGILDLSEDDVIRFYLRSISAGATLSLTTMTVNIIQL